MSTTNDDFDGMDGVDEVLSSVAGRGQGAADDAALTQFLADMRALATGPAPEPSPEVAAMLGGAIPLDVQRTARRRHPIRWSLAAAAAAIVLVTGLAARHTLPQPAQRLVSNVVNNLTPFHIDPNDRDGTPQHRSPTVPAHHPATSTTPAPGPSSPTEQHSSPGSDDGTGGGAGETEHQSSSPGSDDGTSSTGGSDDRTSGGGSDGGGSSGSSAPSGGSSDGGSSGGSDDGGPSGGSSDGSTDGGGTSDASEH